MMDLSIVIPVYNEEESLRPLFAEISESLAGRGLSYEVIFVDDGSRDASPGEVRELAREHKEVKGILLRRNFGQTAAMAAGIEHAQGEVVVFMDADGQNYPRDIPALLAKIGEGHDVVSGWRKGRKDSGFTRIFPSKIANWLIRLVCGVDIHDLGCSLKAYRKEVIKEVRLYGEMHRFIPIYASAVGARITELVVNHRPRLRGTSKYGLMRTFKVLLDLVTVKYLLTYSTRPMHFFGTASVVCMLGAAVSGAGILWNKLVHDVSMIRSPLLLLAAMLFILSVNFVLMGILAEMLTRVYFESQERTSYRIKERVGGAPRTSGPDQGA
jgi:glycosyltransferase involved in cell wall biosynthesis